MVEFTVSDGTLNSTTATAFVSFTLVNNPPIVDLNGPELGRNFTTVFQEGGNYVGITSENIIIRDIDSPLISFSVIQLLNPVNTDQEGLTLQSIDNNLDVLFSADNSSIVVSGEANSSVYSTVFRQLQYYNIAEQPTVEERLIVFLVNDGSANSSLVFTAITVNQVDDVPMLSISNDAVFTTEYIEESSAVRVVDLFAVSISDGDNTTLDNLVIVVDGLQDGSNEVIEFTDPNSDSSLNVQQSNLPDGSRRYVFRLSESSQTIANFELLLQSLRYTNTLLEPTAGFRLLQFTISDGITESIPVYSNLSVVLVNDNTPEFDNFIYSASVMENAVGVIITTLTATDTDASTGQFASHGLIEYRITGGNQDGLFSIDSQTGDIVVVIAKDRESDTGTFGGLLTVEARNPGSSQRDLATVLITITDVNDNAPQFINFTGRFAISELAQSGSVVGVVSAQDIDAGNNAEIRYTLAQTTPMPFFAIDRLTGQITVTFTAQLDYELQPQYTVTITATDRGNPALTNSTLVIIHLIDENDNAPMFEQAFYAMSIFESAQGGDEVLTVTAFDADFGGNDSLVYTITASVPFAIDSASGAVTVNGSLDREMIPGYTFFVTASDPVGNLDSTNVTIAIEDINDNLPTFVLEAYNFSAREDAGVGFIVSAVSAVDRDIGTNADVLYVIEDNVPFRVIPTSGVLVVSQELDREMEDVYQFVVVANNTDGLEGFDAVNVTIIITDVNDNTPVFTEEVYEVTVQENSPLSALIVTVIANDSDVGANAVVTYQLLPSSDSGTFNINETTGEVYLVANVDYETESEYTLTVTATDGTRSSQAVINVSVSDENDNAPVFDPQSYSGTIAENTLSDSILMVQASDSDSGVNQQIVYSILTTDDSFPFSINDSSGVIFLTTMLDREDIDEYVFSVVAEDRGAPSLNSTATVVIAVEDRNDNAPIFDQSSYNISQAEGSEDLGTVIFNVTAVDNDAGSNSIVMYSIITGNERRHFSIHPFTGQVSLVTSLDAETIQQHELVIEASDLGTPVLSSRVTARVDVLNINDNIPVISLNATSVVFQEDGNAITVAPSIAVEDGDVDHLLLQANISLVCPCGNEQLMLGGLSDTIIITNRHITINGPIVDSTLTEILQTVQYINSDEEPDPQDRLVIFTVDDGMAVVSANVTINIVTVNDQPPVIDLNVTDPNTVNSQVTFVEGSLSVLVFGTTINITDEDADGNTLDYIDLTLTGPLDATESITATPNSLVRVSSSGPTMLRLVGPAPHIDFVNTLSSMSYQNTGNNPRQPLQRTVEVTANDGKFNSTAMGIIIIEAVNDQPLIQLSDQLNYSTTFLGGGAPVPIVSSSLSISDPDSPLLQFATIELIDSALDNLEYLMVDSNENISTEINETSVLISGPATITDFTAVLSSATYFNNASNPMLGTRIISFTVSDGQLLSTAYVSVEVIVQNSPPTISLNMGSNVTEFVESGPPVTFIPTNLTITDEDGDMIQSAVVILTNIMDGAQESLQLPPQANLTSTYNASLGQLVIQGEAMPTIYVKALTSVTYSNIAEEPSGVNRLTEVIVSDGLATSDSVTLTISFTLVNDAPRIVLDGGNPIKFSALYFENSNSVSIVNPLSVQVIDVDSPFLSYLTVELLDILDGEMESLIFNSSAALQINSSSDVQSRKYNITFADQQGSIAMYTELLKSARYNNSALEPNATTNRTVIFTVSDGQLTSLSAVTVITIQLVDDNQPQFLIREYTASIDENSSNGTFVAQVSAFDSDIGGTFIYVLESNDVFIISPETGIVTTTGSIDRENVEFYLLTVSLARPGSPLNFFNDQALLTITILDINDNAPVFSDDVYSIRVAENVEMNSVIFTVNVVDADAGINAEIRYSITADTEVFTINSTTGDVILIQSLDREVDDAYSIIIVGEDQGQPSMSSQTILRIIVTDINDSPPVFLQASYVFPVLETVQIGTMIGQVIASDQDSGLNSVLTYSILEGNINDTFTINSTTGTIETLGPLDFAITPRYELIVLASDQGDPSINATVSAVIQVISEDSTLPMFLQPNYQAMVFENVTFDTVVLQVQANDPLTNTSDSIVYSFQDQTISNFAIDPTNGNITVNSSLDRESQDLYQLEVVASDVQNPTRLGFVQITIRILDSNDFAPVFDQPVYNFILEEENESGTLVGTVLAKDDKDIGSNSVVVDYVIEVLDIPFAINSSGAIVAELVANRENESFYEFNVTAIDGGTPMLSGIAIVRITVSDINDNSPVFDQNIIMEEVPENSSIGHSVITVSATDEDEGVNGTVEYRLLGSSPFTINQMTGLITLQEMLDYESVSQYNITVVAEDLGDPTLNSTLFLIINVLNVDDTAPVFDVNQYNFSISENSSISTEVGIITAIDVDSSEIMYEIISGNTQSHFSIDMMGVILVQQSLDRENISEYTLTIAASSNDHTGNILLSSTFVLVIVTDVNDNAPEFINDPYEFSVPENATIGAVVGRFTVTDRDAEFNSLITTMIEDGLFSITGSAVVVSSSLDREAQDSYSLELLAKDTGDPSLTSSTQVIINITDVNDNAPVFSQSLYTVMVADNSTNGTVVFTAVASDADEGPNAIISYSFDNETLPTFSIDSVTGEVTLSGQLDAEVISSYDITIIASDGILLSNATLLIQVGNLDDLPVQFPDTHYVATVGENSPAGSPVTQVVAEDPDITQLTITYGLVNESLLPFQIDPLSGHITVSGVLDREETPEYIITVTASNVPQFTATAIVIINIFDISDEPPTFGENSYQFAVIESANLGTTVGSALAMDPDILGFIVSYSLLPSNSPFIMDFFGNIILASPLDFEKQDKYFLTAFVSDEIGLNSSASVLINVTDANDNSPIFLESSYTAEINETAPIRAVIVSINAMDSDSGTNAVIRYELSPDLSLFEINPSTGIVTVAEDLIDLNQSLYLLDVVATDGGEVPLSSTATLLIRVLSANRPPVFIIDPYEASISEDVSVGSMVVQIQAIGLNENTEILYYLEPNNTFTVNPVTGNITTLQTLDRENISSYALTATAIDVSIDPPLDVKVEVRITVIDVNDNSPQFGENMYNTSLLENSTVGSSVLVIFATDRDISANGAITYSVVQDNSSGLFSINTTSGEIFLEEDIDFETFTVAHLVIRAQDGGMVAMSAMVDVIIEIIDVDDNPPVFDQNQYTVTHPEDLPVSSTIALLQATDADQLDNAAIQYRLFNDSNLFSIDPENGTIILHSPGLDYETVRSYVLIVEAFNPFFSQFSATAIIFVAVTDKNDNAPLFQQTFYVFNVTENSPTQQLIGIVVAEDIDSLNNGNVTYTISSNFVSIGQLTGELRLTQIVDRETIDVLSLEVIAEDQGFPQMTGRAVVNITVIDVNDNPPEINVGTSQFVYVEGSNPINIGQDIAVMDADNALSLQTCSILLEGGNGFISVSNVPSSISTIGTDNFISLTGTASVAMYTTILRSLQFSAANLPEPLGGQRTITISVSDGTFTSNTGVILIDVKLINDNEPVLDLSQSVAGLGFSTTFVEEGGPVSVVGFDATLSDPDEDGEIVHINVTLNGVLDDSLESLVYSEVNNISFEVHTNQSISIVGPGTAGDFVAALMEVMYINYADEPSLGIRNITFTAFDGRFIGSAAISVVRIQLQNDRPVVLLGTTRDVLIVYSESNDSVSITQPGYTITDSDNTMLTSLTVSIQDVDMTIDRLLHMITNDLNLTAEVISGDLQIIGAASLFEYTEVLGSVMYALSTDANGTFEDILSRIVPRVISVVVSDGITTSLPAMATIVFSAINNPPLIVSTEVATFIEESSPVLIAPSIVLTDVDSVNLTSATAHIENVLDNGGTEVLEISLYSPPINVTYDETSNTIFLDGVAPVRKYQELLRNLSYVNTNSEPTEGNRRVIISISDGEASGVATIVVNVKQRNDPPELSAVISNNTFIEQGEPTALISAATLTDEDNIVFASLTVTLSGAVDGINEGIIFPELGSLNLIMSFVPPASVQYDVFFEPRSLGTVENYIQLLEGIAYNNSAEEPSIATRNISLEISDGSNQSVPVIVHVNIELINDNPPVFARTIETTSVAENSPINTITFTAEATDLDIDAEIEYNIYNSSCSDLSINSTSGDVIVTGLLDYEEITQCTITILATDGSFNTSLKLLVNITDENDNAPMFVEDSYGGVVLENQPIGTSVLNVSAIDIDEGSNSEIVYFITANVPFSISQTGSLLTTEELDFEDVNSHSFIVQAVDRGSPSLTSTVPVNIMVENVNEQSPVFDASLPTTVRVPEDTPVNSSIVTISASDPDGNSSIQYSIVDGNYSDIFSIDEVTGELITSRSLDRETEDAYQLLITAVDSGILPLLTAVLQLDIAVLDVNDNSPMFIQRNYNASIPENTTVGSTVVQLTAVDIDIGTNAIIYYNIISGNSDERFGVNSRGEVFVEGELDRERAQECHLEVVASNSPNGSNIDGIQTDTANITIIVTDINDNPPVFTEGQYSFSATENVSIATVIGTVSATDADEGINELIYNIQYLDNLTIPFTINNNGLLSIAELLDYEATQNYEFVVRATDFGNLSGTAIVFVEILNVNDNPPEFFGVDEFGMLHTNVTENLPAGSNITTIKALDRDSLNDLTFGLTYAILYQQELFEINPSTGVVTLIGDLDYENATKHSITISASDSVEGSLTSTAILMVFVEDQNEFSPVFTMDGYSATIPENTTTMSSIITVTATDLDGGSTSVVEYQLLNSSSFTINASSGVVQSVISFDRETTSFYYLILRAFNPFGSPVLESFSSLNITISDVNDNAPTFQEDIYIASVPIGTPAEYFVIRVNATDIDPSNVVIQYSIANTSVPFDISADGSISTTALISELGSYALLVSATDDGDSPLTEFTIVTINVIRTADFEFDVSGAGFLLSSSLLQQFGFFVNAAPGEQGTLIASLLNISATESYTTALPEAVRITKAVVLKDVVYIGSRVIRVVGQVADEIGGVRCMPTRLLIRAVPDSALSEVVNLILQVSIAHQLHYVRYTYIYIHYKAPP